MKGYSVEGFAELFSTLMRVHETSTLFTDFLDYTISYFSNIRWEHKDDYTSEEQEVFHSLLTYYLELLEGKLRTVDWFDFFGEFYESYIVARFKAGDKGQFFTPPEVSELLTSIPNRKGNISNNFIIADHTCWSGRNLLSGHMKYPHAICFGVDLDAQACKMCVLNMFTHGVEGTVLHGDSLKNEYYQGWIVNKELNKTGELSIRKINIKQEEIIEEK